ncbi:unnamed protein product [Caenorhabditis brenneri]
MSSDAPKSIFENSLIVEKILDRVPSGDEQFTDYLRLRLINKKCNEALLMKIRNSHKTVFIDDGAEEGRAGVLQNQSIHRPSIYINTKKKFLNRVLPYFQFLKTVANVEIEELTLKSIEYWNSSDSPYLHTAILVHLIGLRNPKLRKLCGMDFVCPGCHVCTYYAHQCGDFGNLPLSMILNQSHFRNYFKTLNISEQQIHLLAIKLLEASKNKESCFESVSRFIENNIECETLIFTLSDRNSHTLPFELIDSIFKKWKVKEVKLVFLDIDFDESLPGKWLHRSMFTEFNFNSKIDWESDNCFDSVEVDMMDAFNTFQEYFKSEALTKNNNFLANVRRLFPTNRIMITLLSFMIEVCQMDKHIEKLMNIINEGRQRNLDITVRVAPQIMNNNNEIPDIFNSGACLLNETSPEDDLVRWKLKELKTLPDLIVDSVWSLQRKTFKRKSFELQNVFNNSSLHLELLFMNVDLRNFFGERNGKVVGTGFMLHFHEFTK